MSEQKPQKPKVPELAKEVHQLHDGTEVEVRAVPLSRQQALISPDEQSRGMLMQNILAASVYWQGQPLWSADEWEAYSAAGQVKVMARLFKAAQKLSGLDEGDNEKKSDSARS